MSKPWSGQALESLWVRYDRELKFNNPVMTLELVASGHVRVDDICNDD